MKSTTRGELRNFISAGHGYVLIDIREKSELVHGAIPTSHNLPLSELGSALVLLETEPEKFLEKYHFTFTKKDRLILYCRSGSRSARATNYLASKGYDAQNYAGSILDWAEVDKNVEKY